MPPSTTAIATATATATASTSTTNDDSHSDAPEQEVKKLVSLFTETMSSLSEELNVLRQLASLQIATGANTQPQPQPQPQSQSSHGHIHSHSSQRQDQDQDQVDENTDPNTLHSNNRNKEVSKNTSKSKITSTNTITITSTQNQIQQNMKQQLTNINTLLTQLETKVSTIQHVLHEEQQSMEILQLTKESALGQALVIQEIRQGIEDQELEELLPGNANGFVKSGNRDVHGNSAYNGNGNGNFNGEYAPLDTLGSLRVTEPVSVSVSVSAPVPLAVRKDSNTLNDVQHGDRRNNHGSHRISATTTATTSASMRTGTGTDVHTNANANAYANMASKTMSAQRQKMGHEQLQLQMQPKTQTPSQANKTKRLFTTPKLMPTSTPLQSQAQAQPMTIELVQPITQTEFYQISKNTRRRITLSALNDALMDIHNVTQYKYTLLASRSTRNGHGTGNGNGTSSKKTKSKTPLTPSVRGTGTGTGTGTSMMRMQYQQTVALHRELSESIDHDGMPFVSEQEMRDSCAFFRSGESTARAILQILRSAKRLKQICGRKSQVTYALL